MANMANLRAMGGWPPSPEDAEYLAEERAAIQAEAEGAGDA